MSVPEGRQSMIVTANIEFSKWVTVFGDDKMAAAVVDRLVYTGRLVDSTAQAAELNPVFCAACWRCLGIDGYVVQETLLLLGFCS